ncbi:MAG: amidohydrolase [Ktedonobacteraceae bacterium]
MSVSQPDQLKAEIDERVPDLVAMRRDLHEHPEMAFEEVRTSGIVAQRLRALGLEVQTGIAQTGVVGLLQGGAAGPGAKTLAIRADMDALPIHELTEVEYRSQVDGKMHACGHDGHTSIALTVADILSKRRAELKGNIKFVFQPAEESVGGAEPMLQQGALQGVDNIIGLHLISNHPMGRVGVRAGGVFASADKLKLVVHGKGGHGGMPQTAVDPIVISAHVITALQVLVSRESSPFSPAVVTIGTINAGTASNIIPEYVEMTGTMRAFTAEQREYLTRRVQEVANGVALALGGSCDVEVYDGCPPCVNDPAMTELVYQAATATVGEQAVDTGEEIMTTGADDMSYFLNAVPGCYFVVGARNQSKGAMYPHHHPRFNIDEDALPIAVEVLTRAALDYLR